MKEEQALNFYNDKEKVRAIYYARIRAIAPFGKSFGYGNINIIYSYSWWDISFSLVGGTSQGE
ncbi:hypothetical protein [Cylindrospermopsis raciborskii]|uniref:hypothetical protein n=1 Tax=Cylindrospermopsis raciborskii TaxID=77022 RepID=UPI001F2EDFBC|nr:hypothetical protein [Cylindrospermopsis raciborskii]